MTRYSLHHSAGLRSSLRRTALAGLCWLSGALAAPLALAHGDHPPAAEASVPAAENSTALTLQARLPDVWVTHQLGQKMRLQRDLLQHRIAVISFIYTSCPTICSPLTANLKQAHDLLEPAVAERTQFLSFTLDPSHDTPEVLQAFAKRVGTTGSWAFVSAKPSVVKQIQAALAVRTRRKEDHTPLVFIGDNVRGHWVIKPGLGNPQALAETITSAVTQQGEHMPRARQP